MKRMPVRAWSVRLTMLLSTLVLAASASAQQKVLTLDAYPSWNRITSTELSADGRWLAYAYSPNEGDATLFLRDLTGARVDTIARGASPRFSDDGRWAVAVVSPPEKEQEAARKAKKPVVRTHVLREVATGRTIEVQDVATFAFANGSRWVALRRNRAEGAKHDGTDLVLHDLEGGTSRVIGSVSEYAFDDAGAHLAYVVDAADDRGNGVYVQDLESGRLRVLDEAAATYAGLAWSKDGGGLAVLRGTKDETRMQRDNVLLVFRPLDGAAVKLDPAEAAGFPEDMVISEFEAPEWSEDGARVFIGLHGQETEPEKTDEPVANVDVWHWNDEMVQSVQMVRINQLRRATLAAVFHVTDGRFVRLADEDMPTVQRTADGNGRWAVGRKDAAYRREVAWGGGRADWVRIDVRTGERTPIVNDVTRTYGISPDGRWFLFLRGGTVFAHDLERGRDVDISTAAGVSFVDARDDHPYEKPIYGLAGWTKDGESVLLYHDFDIWSLGLDGRTAENLTQGVGDREGIRFRIERLDDEERTIDTSGPLLLSAYGEWTKRSGYWRLPPGGRPEPLVFEDAMIDDVEKAADTDRVVFTRQTFVDFPDWYATDLSFRSPVRITNANPQQAEFAWGRRILVDYENSKGQKLQATLALPANYERGKRYPMLVYFYEIMSNQHHRYSAPVYDDRPHMSEYASDGYLVLQPDVVYEEGRPGSSALDCVTAAVRKVIELGYADPAHIGLQGHSWGGYQSSFIVTQTDLFAAVVTGAPVTNLTSFYNELYKSTGTVQQGIVELGQVRMGTTPYEDYPLYMSQSPVHQAEKITTPFLILHGTDDGSVDWHQGLEFYNAARRLGKQVILLSYPGEGHHLGRKENQIDFQKRMKAFFDHYLKGTPAPEWMTEGVSQLRKGRTDITGRS